MSVSDDPRPPGSSWNVVRGDFFGGVAAGVVALPLALAFGVSSGLGPVAGLYGAIAIGIVAAVFGGTPVQISGPTGPMTLVVAGIVATNTLPSGAVNLPGVVAIVVLAGLLQIALGLVPDRRLHPLRSLPRHLRVHDRHWGDHHPSAVVPDAGRGAAVFGAFVDPPPVASAGRQHQMGRRCLIRLDHCDGLHTAAIHESGSSLARCPGSADGAGGVAGA